MQANVPIFAPSTSLNPLKDAAGVAAVDYSTDFASLDKKIDNFMKLFDQGKGPGELVRYIPGLTKPLFQGQIDGTQEKKAFADDTYKDLKTAEFTIQLSSNHYMNFNNVHIVFPLKIKKKTNVANDILATEITVNNFFAHWIKEIDIKRLGDDVPVLPTTNTIEIYKYSDAMLKHVPKKALKVIENDLLYSRKKVKLPAGEERRDEHTANAENANNRTDDNIDERIQKFQNQLKTDYFYRIPLKYICNLGKVNQPIRFNTKWRITFEQDMQRLFETNTNLGAAAGLPDTIDAKIILKSTPYLLYTQFKLDTNFRNYLETALVSESKLRTGIQKTPYQKSYELIAGAQSRTINFNNALKQFSFLEISLVYDRSDKHLRIFDSYNAEVASTQIKSIKLQNASNTYSEFNTVKFDLEDEEDRYTLYNAFVAFVTEGSSIIAESEYMNNEVRQELPNRNTYFTDSDERVYIDIRRSKGFTGELERVNRDDSDLTVTVDLKAAATKKMRLRITGYFQGEYNYMISSNGLIMNYKEYGVSKIKTAAEAA